MDLFRNILFWLPPIKAMLLHVCTNWWFLLQIVCLLKCIFLSIYWIGKHTKIKKYWLSDRSQAFTVLIPTNEIDLDYILIKNRRCTGEESSFIECTHKVVNSDARCLYAVNTLCNSRKNLLFLFYCSLSRIRKFDKKF